MRNLEPAPVAILVFAKRPRQGYSKTRLAKDLGAELATRFATAFLGDTLRRLSSEQPHPVILCGTEENADQFAPFLQQGQNYRWQGEGDLGERMQRNFEGIRDEIPSCAGIIALGADTPHLPIEWLEIAAAELRRNKVVLGPSSDGGYYLLGIPHSFPNLPLLFQELPWGQETLLATTRARLQQAQHATAELPVFWDIDESSDLVQWGQRLRDEGFGAAAHESTALLEEFLEEWSRGSHG